MLTRTPHVQAQDKSITVQGFSGEIFPAYEIIFTNWLPSKESKVPQ